MSQAIIARLQSELGDRIVATSDFRGDEEVQVKPADWVAVATFLRDDLETALNHFIDITAVDHPEREDARFDVLLIAHSVEKAHRVRVRTAIKDGEELDTLCGVWAGANWAEREVFDMFGIRFKGHPDLRRILMYEEFEGYPLRKDYPIDRTQPLVPYRSVEDIQKLPPFGIEEGQPFARIDWEERLAGRDQQVSPAIGVQVGQRRALSDSEAAQYLQEKIAAQAAAAGAGGEAGDGGDAAEGSGE